MVNNTGGKRGQKTRQAGKQSRRKGSKMRRKCVVNNRGGKRGFPKPHGFAGNGEEEASRGCFTCHLRDEGWGESSICVNKEQAKSAHSASQSGHVGGRLSITEKLS